MKSGKELKSQARQLLQGKYSGFIVLFLSAYILQNLIVSLPSMILATPTNLPLFLSQILLTVLLEALGAMILIGVNRGALQLIRGKNFSLSDLFFSFKNQVDHFLALELILTAINTFTSIPGFLFAWNSPDSMNFLTFSVISGIWSAVSIALTFLITLVFSMSEFLMLDDPSMTAGESLRYSMTLMRGHIGQYFLLNLSFLGYILLGILSGMIAFIWIVPYILVTHALFYENLCDLQDEANLNYE